MTDIYKIKLKDISKQLIENINVMDFYAKYEITARDDIAEGLLYGDGMKALDRAVQKLNDTYKQNMLSAEI